MKSNVLLFWLAVLFVFSGSMLAILLVRYYQRHGDPGDVEVSGLGTQVALPPGPVTEFTLTERSGRQFSSKELEGEVWVASFFFSRCPADCAQQNRHVQELQREFGDRGVRFVSISSDPVNDTPSVLTEYARRFNADPEKWLFLTGNLDYIVRIGRDMFYVPVRDQNGNPTHFNLLYAMDRAGQMHPYSWADPSEFAELKTKLDEFLAATPEEARAAAEAARGQSGAETEDGDATGGETSEGESTEGEPAEGEADSGVPSAESPSREDQPDEEQSEQQPAEGENDPAALARPQPRAA